MITLQNITLCRGPHILFEGVNWTIFEKQRVGIVGVNGSGKSSLFALFTEELTPEKGNLLIPTGLKLAHVAQETPALDQPALEFVLEGDSELKELQQKLLRAEENNNGIEIAALHEELNIIGAYSASARAAELLAGLGFKTSTQKNPVKSFSGGWRMRLNLARALMRRSDVLLLDEPTNHLDLDAVFWLEQWLQQYPGTLLLISHDREFLDNVVSHIAHLKHQTLKLYTGNYSSFEKQYAAHLIQQQAASKKQQSQLAHMQAFVARFRAKASKSKQAQSRLKAIERMEMVSSIYEDSTFQFCFKAPAACPNPLLRLENVTLGFGDQVLVKNINVSITPKDRIAILGPNGAGKSTIMKYLAGELKSLEGKYEPGAGLKIGYFAQHQVDQLELERSALEHLQALTPDASELELRTYLGSFGFPGDYVFQAVKQFSGGEKSRLALALLIWQRPNLLLLDEPTNHLDLDMRNALSAALQIYEGALVLVSHDRFLVQSCVDQLFLLADSQLQTFTGDLHDYHHWLLHRKNSAHSSMSQNSDSKKSQRQQNAKQREILRPLQQKIKQQEQHLSTLQQSLTLIETKLTEPEIFDTARKDDLQECLLTQAKLKKELHLAEEAYLTTYEEYQQLIESLHE